MKKGYTLIELLVGISIFSLIAASVTGFFISALRAQRKILAVREIVDSASYVLDYMANAIRMAKKDDIEIRGQTTNCLAGYKVNYQAPIGGSEIRFRYYNPLTGASECLRFFLESTTYRLKEWRNGIENYLSPNDLEITNLKFIVSGDTSGDTLQPKVTILLEIQKKNQPDSRMAIQTTISQRDLDL